MKVFKRNITWIGTGLLLAMTAGSPVLADDTELLLVQPDITEATKPRIMFIIDTSTSMKSTEDTAVPYDKNQTYAGDCDSSKIYWMAVEGIYPDCAGGTDQFIDKTSFYCDAATLQMNGLGSFAGVFAQYRDGGKDGTESGKKVEWQFLSSLYPGAPVECEDDFGIHGDGRPDFFWPTKKKDDADPWTDKDKDALEFNGAPRNQNYTMYDGNYLNWEANPVIVSERRIDIVKQVLTTIFSSVSGVRVGVERFNDNEGGTIIQGLIDIDTNRADALAAVDSLTPEDHTTIAESLYESALYWLGRPARFGEIDGDNENFTDHAILVDPASIPPDQVYIQPELNECAKNFNVLLSDGRAGGNDDKTVALTPTLPGYQAATGRTFCDDVVASEPDGICADDIAEYLRYTDISPDASGGLPGNQYVTTHTVGFAIDTENLRSAAERSGGTYYQADDGPSLARAFLNIINVIADRDLSFVAPAVSVNAFNRTQNLNDLYLTVFKPAVKVHWPGNLKKYKLVNRVISDVNGSAAVDPATGFFFDSAKSYWTTGVADGSNVELGGAAHALPDPAVRNLYTNNSGTDLTAANNQITPSNAAAFTDADFGLTGSAGEPSKDEIIRWARGEDLLDDDNDPATNVRYAMGDPLHSKPAAVVYGGTETNPDIVVFSATNDGYLHAIDGSSGQELWSFVPKEMLPRFTQLYFDTESKYKQYGIDGNVVSVVKDDNDNGVIDGSDFVYILFGLRRGGSRYYALDVTSKNSPKLLWDVTYPEFGESWSTPVVTRVDINVAGINADKAVVILGGGYDNIHDTATYPSTAADAVGSGIHMLDLVTGARLWRAGNDAGADLTVAGMTRSIPSQVRVIDMTGDGFANRMYAADMGGQLLRFDIKKGETPANLVTGGVIAQLGAEGDPIQDFDVTRRFYTTPDVSLFQDRLTNRRFISISIGSGYRAHPLDESAADHFFSVRDPDVFNRLTAADYSSYDVVTIDELVEVSGSVRTVIPADKRGWKFTLPPNQKVLSDSITFNDVITFVAFAPEEVALTNTCAPQIGRNYLYRVSVENGDPAVNNLDTVTAADADNERMEELAQGGIAPAPTILFPSPDDPDNCTGSDCAPPPLGCVGVECFDPGFANNPVRTLWTQDGIQ